MTKVEAFDNDGQDERLKNNLDWKEILNTPESLSRVDDVMYAAGGGLVRQFGNSDSLIWQKMIEVSKQNENKDQITFAGIDFSIRILADLGNFYREYADDSAIDCVDERLSPESPHHHVHCQCGACAAIRKMILDSIGLDIDVENQLARELNLDEKQDIHDDMPNHRTKTILVSFNDGGLIVDPEQNQAFKEKDLLPFNASVPIEAVYNYCDGDLERAKELIGEMIKLNVNIPGNLIADPHNELANYADNLFIAVDQVDASTQTPEIIELQEYALESISEIAGTGEVMTFNFNQHQFGQDAA